MLCCTKSGRLPLPGKGLRLPGKPLLAAELRLRSLCFWRGETGASERLTNRPGDGGAGGFAQVCVCVCQLLEGDLRLLFLTRSPPRARSGEKPVFKETSEASPRASSWCRPGSCFHTSPRARCCGLRPGGRSRRRPGAPPAWRFTRDTFSGLFASSRPVEKLT